MVKETKSTPKDKKKSGLMEAGKDISSESSSALKETKNSTIQQDSKGMGNGKSKLNPSTTSLSEGVGFSSSYRVLASSRIPHGTSSRSAKGRDATKIGKANIITSDTKNGRSSFSSEKKSLVTSHGTSPLQPNGVPQQSPATKESTRANRGNLPNFKEKKSSNDKQDVARKSSKSFLMGHASSKASAYIDKKTPINSGQKTEFVYNRSRSKHSHLSPKKEYRLNKKEIKADYKHNQRFIKEYLKNIRAEKSGQRDSLANVIKRQMLRKARAHQLESARFTRSFRGKDYTPEEMRNLRADVNSSKANLKQAKNLYRKKSLKWKLLRTPKHAAKGVGAVAWTVAMQDENLQEIQKMVDTTRSTYRNAKLSYKGAKLGGNLTWKTSKAAFKASKKTVQVTYKGGKFLYQNGAKKTAQHVSKKSIRFAKTKARNAAKDVKNLTKPVTKFEKKSVKGAKKSAKTARELAKKTYRAGKFVTQSFRQMMQAVQKATIAALKGISTFIVTLATNPITWIVAGVVGIFMLVILVLATAMSPVSSDEFDTNDAWLHVTKRDAEKSDDTVKYFSNIDDQLYYMGYRFDDWKLNDKLDDGWFSVVNPFADTGASFLDKTWDKLNADKHNLKTMEYLFKNDDDYKMSEDELEDYNEKLEEAKEVGLYNTSGELGNPFYEESDEENWNKPIPIKKRFGYTEGGKLQETQQLSIEANHDIFVVMDGKIKSIDKGKVVISTDDTEFTYENLTDIRVKVGDTVSTGDKLAKSETSYITVTYKKVNDDKGWLSAINPFNDPNKLIPVNAGFYFQSVVYLEKTYLISKTSNFAGDVVARAKAVYEQIKQRFPEASDEAIAAMLGNWMVESSINPKRAEGDYLNPPVGATDSSWDDESWLNMGGPSIYGGAYPNILHRGLGLGQWTDTRDGAVRNTLLREFAKSKGKKWYDLDLQIDFMFDGDSPYYRSYINSFLKRKEDIKNLTYDFLVKWEGNMGDKLLERQQAAENMLALIRGGF